MQKLILFFYSLLLTAGLGAQIKVAKPEDHGMDPERLARVDAVIADAIGAGDIPGAVHDPLARLANGGNSGNAGVFSDAVDLSRICMMVLNNGHAYKDVKLGFREPDTQVLSRAAVRLMTTVPPENAPSVGRALGWDVSSEHSGLRGDLFNPETTLMHTGYTGTSLVIDLDTHTAIVLLTNRVHPHDDGSVARLRALVSNIVAGAIKY